MAGINITRIELHVPDPDLWAAQVAVSFHRRCEPSRWRVFTHWQWERKLDALETDLRTLLLRGVDHDDIGTDIDDGIDGVRW